MSNSKVLLAIPTRGQINANTVEALFGVWKEHPEMEVPFIARGALSVSDTRHQIVKYFLAGHWDWLLMVDDDVVPSRKILALTEPDDTYDIVGAWYLMVSAKINVPFPAAFQHNPSKQSYQPIKDVWSQRGRTPCDAIGTGCVAIRRRVLADPQMAQPFQMGYDTDGIMTMSDDIRFCHRARELGYTIAMDFDIRCDHLPTSLSLNRMHMMYDHLFQHTLDTQVRKKMEESEDRKVITMRRPQNLAPRIIVP